MEMAFNKLKVDIFQLGVEWLCVNHNSYTNKKPLNIRAFYYNYLEYPIASANFSASFPGQHPRI